MKIIFSNKGKEIINDDKKSQDVKTPEVKKSFEKKSDKDE